MEQNPWDRLKPHSKRVVDRVPRYDAIQLTSETFGDLVLSHHAEVVTAIRGEIVIKIDGKEVNKYDWIVSNWDGLTIVPDKDFQRLYEDE